MESMVNVELTDADYERLDLWFITLFGKKNNASKGDKFLMSKLIQMREALRVEKESFKDMMNEK